MEDLDLPATHDDVLLLVHPWLAPIFTTAIHPGWTNERVDAFVLDEVNLVLGESDRWKINYEYIGTADLAGRRVDRILVMCLPRATLSLRDVLRAPRLEVRSTIGVITELVINRDGLQSGPGRMTIGIGWYGSRAEVCAVENGVLRCCGFVEFESADEGWRKLDSFVESFTDSGSIPGALLLYGHLDDIHIERTPASEAAFSTAARGRLVPKDLFGNDDSSLTGDPLFGVSAAGAMVDLLSRT